MAFMPFKAKYASFVFAFLNVHEIISIVIPSIVIPFCVSRVIPEQWYCFVSFFNADLTVLDGEVWCQATNTNTSQTPKLPVNSQML